MPRKLQLARTGLKRRKKPKVETEEAEEAEEAEEEVVPLELVFGVEEDPQKEVAAAVQALVDTLCAKRVKELRQLIRENELGEELGRAVARYNALSFATRALEPELQVQACARARADRGVARGVR